MHNGHRKRMKERLEKEGGFERFAPHEILEMLLYSTNARSDTNPIAHQLIDTFGSLANVFEADKEDLKAVPGVGESSAFLNSMIPHLSRAYMQGKWDRRELLGSTEKSGQYAIDLFIGKEQEELHLICLDSGRRVFYTGCLLKGTIDEVPAYPRVIVSEVIKRNARHIILAHNHPNGSSFPSPADELATAKIEAALSAIGVELIDHIIVSGNSYYSMAEHEQI